MNGARALRIGRIFGIQLAVDASWFFVVVLMTWNLAVVFAHWHPDWNPGTTIATAVVASLLFFASVVLHELAHSLVARAFGVPVSSITLFLFGGVSNIEREPPSAKAEFLTAIVGPLTSIGLGIVLVLVASLAVRMDASVVEDPRLVLARLTPGETLLSWLGPINILVGVFNLIPGFPLDGGRVLRSALWAITRDLHTATRSASAVGQAIGWGFVVVGVAIAFGAQVPFFGRGLVSGMWLAFIGWFLASAAAQTWRRQLVSEILEGVDVSRLMRPAGRAVPADMDLETLVSDWLMRADDHSFIVVDAAMRLAGIVTLADVRRAAREQWQTVRVAQVMTPVQRLVTAAPGEPVASALDKLVRADVSQLPVLDGDRLVGTLLRRDIARWIELHASADLQHRRTPNVPT